MNNNQDHKGRCKMNGKNEVINKTKQAETMTILLQVKFGMKIYDLEHRIYKLEHPELKLPEHEGVPGWVERWLDEAERVGKMEEILKLAKLARKLSEGSEYPTK